MEGTSSGRPSRRTFALLLWAASVAALCILAVGPPALAEAPLVIHDHFEGEFSAPDFCGSGITVDVAVSAVQTVHLDDSVQVNGRFRAVITNPENGASVVLSSAGRMRLTASGDPGGTFTIVATFTGLPEKIQVEGGEVLLRDAGFISFVDTFEGFHLVSSEVIVKGPHPEADSDFTLFCSTIVPALS